MRAQKPRIDSLISEQLCLGPQAVKLCAKLQLIKYQNDESDNAEDERIEINANSLMNPVYSNGLTIAAYWGMVKKMMSVSKKFASMGSGWVLEKAPLVDVKFARFRPIRSSSYIAFPTKITNCRGLLNIRNHEDHQCFRYSYVAACHLHRGIS